jgi:transcriptional regulator with XRE-family HTH domain
MFNGGLNGAPIARDIADQDTRPTVTLGQNRDGGVKPPTQRLVPRVTRQLTEFGERIQLIRRNRRWSIRELSGRSRINPTTLYRIEDGKNITLGVVWRLANGLQMHWADLVDDRTTDAPAEPTRELLSFHQQVTDLGIRVYQIRTGQRLSLRALTARAGVNKDTIFALEAGTQNIRLDTLLRLAAGLDVHPADLLDDRLAQAPRPESRLHEALEQTRQLRAQVQQLRTQLTLAQARAAVAERVAEQRAAQRLTNAAQQSLPLLDRFDRPRLAALRPSQLAVLLDVRRTLYDDLDRICRDGQRHHLDQGQEWTGVAALRTFAQHLTATVLDEQMRKNPP